MKPRPRRQQGVCFSCAAEVLRWGRPVTTDQFVFMDKGPVVSRIYNLIREEPEPGETSVWRRFISEPQNHEVALLREAPADELSGAEEELIAEVFAEHGHTNRRELVRLTHDLPEWRGPEGSAVPARVIRGDALPERGFADCASSGGSAGLTIHAGQGPGVLPASAWKALNLAHQPRIQVVGSDLRFRQWAWMAAKSGWTEDCPPGKPGRGYGVPWPLT